jgi:membrane associated rhomboid family serine protease
MILSSRTLGEISGVGFYDREYYREERPGFSLRAPRTIVSALILINIVFWVVDGFSPATGKHSHWLSDHMAVHVNDNISSIPALIEQGKTTAEDLQSAPVIDTPTQPWLWWQYVSYAFAHAPGQLNHLLFNMLALFFLAYDVEAAYGHREFWRFYFATAIFAAVVWSLAGKLSGSRDIMYGASGAITGVVMLYALNFPRRMLLLFMIIPVPAWVVGALLIAMNLYGAMFDSPSAGGANVAYVVHLAGAAFALIYYQQRWNLTRWTSAFSFKKGLRRRPKLRIHQTVMEHREQPAKTTSNEIFELGGNLSEEVDRILEKIYREGEAKLTTKERRILETASREYQRKGRIGGKDPR